MKKNLLFTLGVTSLGLTSYSITYMRVQQTDGSEAQFAMDKVEQVDFFEKEAVDTTSSANYEYVDLGLPSGTLWATYNIGASKPEEVGDYFSWGETENKDYYNWSSYKWCISNNGCLNLLTKYNLGHYYNGTIDNLQTLLTQDDVSSAQWGSEWRMPTNDEFQELIDNCKYSWTEYNGVYGAKFTASNGNSMFLPVGGYYECSTIYDADSRGFYWSSSLANEYEFCALNVFFRSEGVNINIGNRRLGFPVRSVRREKKLPTVNDTTSITYEYVDLGLPSGTLWAAFNVGATKPEEYGDYFAWGETKPKEIYALHTYKWAITYHVVNFKRNHLDPYTGWLLKAITKYNRFEFDFDGEHHYRGPEDNLTTLQPEDDAATANWGTEWHTPTREEIDELIENCIYSDTIINGVRGSKYTASNGNSIFMPAGGYYEDSDYLNDYNPYLSSSFGEGYLFADALSKGRISFALYYYGCLVRPVRSKK